MRISSPVPRVAASLWVKTFWVEHKHKVRSVVILNFKRLYKRWIWMLIRQIGYSCLVPNLPFFGPYRRFFSSTSWLIDPGFSLSSLAPEAVLSSQSASPYWIWLSYQEPLFRQKMYSDLWQTLVWGVNIQKHTIRWIELCCSLETGTGPLSFGPDFSCWPPSP